MRDYKNLDDYLIQSSNLASIVKLCSDIQKGIYNFYEDTNKIYNSLISRIGIDDAYIVYGNAGTGKSVLALKLFFENPDSKILLMNSKLYYCFSFDSQYYHSGRATFNTDDFISIIDKNTISIIDECQRLDIKKIVDIISKSKITYLFGDHKQACFKNCTLDNEKQLKEKLTNEYGFAVSVKTLKKARRYNDEVNKALEFLTSSSNKDPENVLPKDYNIEVYFDANKFINKYETTDGIKKIYAPMVCASRTLVIGDKRFTKANYNDDSFSTWPNNKDYYGTTYHALSFDIDHCFVYLGNTKIIRFNNRQYIYHENLSSNPLFDEIQLFTNELNVLFTRGRKSLNIMVSDIESYLYLNFLINKLKRF